MNTSRIQLVSIDSSRIIILETNKPETCWLCCSFSEPESETIVDLGPPLTPVL